MTDDAISDGGALAKPAGEMGTEAPAFPYQLMDAYLHSATLERREATDGDPDRPAFETTFMTESGEAQDRFHAHLTVVVTFRFRADKQAVCRLTVCTTGMFLQTRDIDDASSAQFQKADCAVLLWPYARAQVGELVRMAGLAIPPLPTIDVRRTLTTLHSEG